MNKIHVIGIGYRPFDEKARETLLNAEGILASPRLFEAFKRYEEFSLVKDKIIVISKVDETLGYIRDNLGKHKMVLLASGDPLFFGIGTKTIAEFGRDRVEIHPDLSSIQLAFARIKELWDDAFLISLHGGPDPEKRRRLPYEIDDIPSLLQAHYKIAILTDRENNPTAIAKTLLKYIGPESLTVIARSGSDEAISTHKIASPEPAQSETSRLLRFARNDRSEGDLNDYIKMFVCERLGYPDEKTTSGTPEEIVGMTFSEPNIVIITKDHKSEVSGQESANKKETMEGGFGLSENEIAHSRGLITKDEIRAVSIHKLRLPKKGVLWDIGAGSGSVSVEAAQLYPKLKIYAIEKDKEQIANIEENKTRFGVPNITTISGEAPGVLRDLPFPDRVFIGGNGGRLEEMIGIVKEKLPKGIIVINAVTLETLNEAAQLLETNGFDTDISQVSVSRSKVLNGQRHMSALNPVFIIRGEKK